MRARSWHLNIPMLWTLLWTPTIPSYLGPKHGAVTTLSVTSKHYEWPHPSSLWEGQVVAWNLPIWEAGKGHFCGWCFMTIGWIIGLLPFTGTSEKKSWLIQTWVIWELKIVRGLILLSEWKRNILLKFLLWLIAQIQCQVHLMQKSTAKEEQRNQKDMKLWKTKGKMADVNSTVSIITWDVNGLNNTIKILLEYIKYNLYAVYRRHTSLDPKIQIDGT